MAADRRTSEQAGGTAPSEIELKFEITPADLKILADHPALTGKPKIASLRSTYYDTPDCDLRRKGLTLRLRRSGRAYVQTVKRTSGSNVFHREEWESKVSGPELDAEALAHTPAAKVLKKAKAQARPLFASINTRQLWTYSLGDATIEATVDKGRVEAGDKREPIWELELELKSGDPKKLYALARSLFALTPLRLSLTTKYARGYRLISGETGLEDKRLQTGLNPAMSVGEAFAAIMRACLMQTLGAADVLKRTRQPEGVHQTRVGLRRMRTALRLFEDVTKDDLYPWIVGELRWLAGALGDARELDVYIDEGFRPAAPKLENKEAAARYGQSLEGSRKSAYDQAMEAISSPRFARLMLEIALWVEDGAWKSQAPAEQKAIADSPIGPFASVVLGNLRRKLRKRGSNLASLEPADRHKLRIWGKRLRYASQFFADAFGDGDKKRRKFDEALKALQTQLGRLNDIAVADERASAALRADPDPDLALVGSRVVERLKKGEPRLLAKAVKAYEAFADAKPYWPAADKAG